MRHGQLSLMLETLHDVFAGHPQGLTVDGLLASLFADGLKDMTRAALALEQQVLALQDQFADCGQAPLFCPVAPAQDNVVPFPVIPRPRPMPIEGGCP